MAMVLRSRAPPRHDDLGSVRQGQRADDGDGVRDDRQVSLAVEDVRQLQGRAAGVDDDRAAHGQLAGRRGGDAALLVHVARFADLEAGHQRGAPPRDGAAVDAADEPLALEVREVPTDGLARDVEGLGQLGHVHAALAHEALHDLLAALELEQGAGPDADDGLALAPGCRAPARPGVPSDIRPTRPASDPGWRGHPPRGWR